MKIKFLLVILVVCGFAQAEIPVVQWAKSFGLSSFIYPSTSAFDSKGNMYVVGYLWNPTFQIGTAVFNYQSVSDIVTFYVVKYDLLGNVIWVKAIEGVSTSNGIVVDKSD